MSTKHFFPSTSGVVIQGLASLCHRTSHLALDAPNKVVYDTTFSTSETVAIISGGGSGHEPAWSGYVGKGMLAAAVCGEVFASPSTKQVLAAIEQVMGNSEDYSKGVILCITNYTADNLHFGLAREKARALGLAGGKIALLRMTDDVGLGRVQTQRLGRRGLAGNMFVLKLCGATSLSKWAFDKVLALGQSVNDHCVTIGSSLDYCHIPGRAHHESLPEDTFSIAQGIHNEPGLKTVSPIPGAEELVSNLLSYLLSPADTDRAFVPFARDDVTALLINNFGGVSNFELEALTVVTLELLKRDWGVEPRRVLVGAFETSLNAPGWSISLLNISGVESETGVRVETIIDFLDSETEAPAWPRNGYRHASTAPSMSPTRTKAGAGGATRMTGPRIVAQDLDHALRTACQRTIAAEPEITKWDIQMGDGDCGEATSAICASIQRSLDAGLCTTEDGRLLRILEGLGACVEEVGGTLGAILAIFVASFTSSLRNLIAPSSSSGDDNRAVDIALLSQAAEAALHNLQTYTSARVGGRTVMDTLIPFCTTLSETQDLKHAVCAAEIGARATEGMGAIFGRASYVGGREVAEGNGPEANAGAADVVPMDPGAWALAVFLAGLGEGFEGSGGAEV